MGICESTEGDTTLDHDDPGLYDLGGLADNGESSQDMPLAIAVQLQEKAAGGGDEYQDKGQLLGLVGSVIAAFDCVICVTRPCRTELQLDWCLHPILPVVLRFVPLNSSFMYVMLDTCISDSIRIEHASTCQGMSRRTCAKITGSTTLHSCGLVPAAASN